MSFGGKAKKSKSKAEENIVQQQTIHPKALEALTSVIEGANTLRNNDNPIVAGLNQSTLAGLDALEGQGSSAFVSSGAQTIDDALKGRFLQSQQVDPSIQQVSQTASGEFQGQNPALGQLNPALWAVQDRIVNAAQTAVGDRFSRAGRTGSPAEAVNLSKTVARELAPFQFQALENNLNRTSNSFEAERQRQLAASQLGLNQFNAGVGQVAQFAGLAPAFEQLSQAEAERLLRAGNIRQQQEQNELDVPFLKFERFANPLIAASGGLPVGLTRQGRSKQSGSELTVGGSFGF